MNRTQDYIDRRKNKAKDDMIRVMKEIEKIDLVLSSPNYRKHALYIDTLTDNMISLKASAFSESDPRNLRHDEAKALVGIIKGALERKKEELDKIIND